MKIIKYGVPLLAVALLCGCFQVQDDLTINADGSGKVRLTLQSHLPEELAEMLTMSSRFGEGNEPSYPPVNEAQARRFFPAKDFTVKTDPKGADSGKTLVVEASFKDINALLASPYARAHQLLLKTNANGALQLQALSGGGTLAQAAQFKAEGEMAAFSMPGLEEAQKQKGEMRLEFRVTLPAAISEANGVRENKTAIWVFERAKCKDDEEFAARLTGVLEASCPAQAIQFSPVTPPRLGLLAFRDLVPGKTASAALPDTNKIAAAVQFVPYALQVTRSLDLSGEGAGRDSHAQLTGAVVLPAELAPQRWGEAKLEEALDAKGNSLMPKEDDAMSQIRHYSRFGMRSESEEEESTEATAPKGPSPKQHMVTLSFKAPDWKVKEIAKIKGVLELQYLGGTEVVKLSNAVPADLVMDMSKRSRSSFNFNSERGQISDSRLAELGFFLRVQSAMVQSSMTMLSLETSGTKASLVEAQLFDAEGHPWPTTLSQPERIGGEKRYCQLMIPGRPKPPFSLALVVGGVGASVNVPLLVEKVPVAAK